MFRQIRAALMLPFTVTVIVPLIILATTGGYYPGWRQPFPTGLLMLIAGLGIIAAGLALVVGTVRLFATIGEGTLAPWDPTRKLVVVGVYRHVRNPMISGVVAILLGEAVLLGSPPLLIWCLLVFVINIVYIPLSEEPGLARRFGDDYRLYQQNVPRWLPRPTPWIQPEQDTV